MKRPRSGSSTAASQETKTKHQAVSAVEVVTCAASFPISQTKRTKHNNYHEDTDDAPPTDTKRNRNTKSTSKLLDWNETVREVQKFGAQGWGAATIRSKKYGSHANAMNDDDGDNMTKNIVSNTIIERKKFRMHQNEQYELLTGRKKKQHAVPLPIVRGIKKKAIAREERIRKEAKDAGIVLPMNSLTTTTKPSSKQKEQMKKQQNFKMNQQHGPAPSIGFMKQGMYQVRHNKGGGGGGGGGNNNKSSSGRKRK